MSQQQECIANHDATHYTDPFHAYGSNFAYGNCNEGEFIDPHDLLRAGSDTSPVIVTAVNEGTIEVNGLNGIDSQTKTEEENVSSKLVQEVIELVTSTPLSNNDNNNASDVKAVSIGELEKISEESHDEVESKCEPPAENNDNLEANANNSIGNDNLVEGVEITDVAIENCENLKGKLDCHKVLSVDNVNFSKWRKPRSRSNITKWANDGRGPKQQSRHKC